MTIIKEGWNGDMEEKAGYNVKIEIEFPRDVVDCFMLKNTAVTEKDIELIVQAMKNESMLIGQNSARDRLIELSLLFERIAKKESWGR